MRPPIRWLRGLLNVERHGMVEHDDGSEESFEYLLVRVPDGGWTAYAVDAEGDAIHPALVVNMPQRDAEAACVAHLEAIAR